MGSIEPNNLSVTALEFVPNVPVEQSTIDTNNLIKLVEAIESWYRVTWIHLLKRNDGSHWNIELHHLLQIEL